jgi:hypothetical protein
MDETLDFIRRELRYRLGLADDEVMLDNARTLSRASDTRGVVITLVNVGVSTYQGSVLKQPGWQDLLEITVLISFRFPHYKTSLMHLNKTMQLFYTKPAYAAADAHPENPFPAGLERLMLTLSPQDFGALKDLWGMLGDAQVPSVVYNLRMVQTRTDVIPH